MHLVYEIPLAVERKPRLNLAVFVTTVTTIVDISGHKEHLVLNRSCLFPIVFPLFL